jgi:cGMP-dependent protein kinase 2
LFSQRQLFRYSKHSKHHVSYLQNALAKVLVFNKLDPHIQRRVVTEMYERTVAAGEILIKEGDTGMAATELYVVKEGKFEVSTAAAGQ